MHKSIVWLLIAGVMVGGCGNSASNMAPAAVPPVVVRTDPATAMDCPNGGSVVLAGLDANGDGVLNDAEIKTRTVLCNAPPPQPPPTILVRLVNEPRGANCAEGGTAVESGPDLNGNAQLDDNEVMHTDYVCGKAALTRIAAEPPGANCVDGGVAFQAGIDDNNNGVLDDGEVRDTEFECSDILSRGVDIHTAAELAALANIRVINGAVTIENTTLAQVSLPSLEHVEQAMQINQDPVLARITLPKLQSVGGGFAVSQDPALVAIDVPVMRQVGSLFVGNDQSLPDLNGLAMLQQVTRHLTIINNTALTSAAMPIGSVTGVFQVSGNPALTSLSVHSDAVIDQLLIFDNAIQTLDINLEAGVDETITIESNANLATASIRMQLMDDLSVSGNGLGSLVIDVPSILGSVSIQETELINLSFPDFNHGDAPFPLFIPIRGSFVLSAPIEDPAQFPPSLPLQIAGDCILDGTPLTSLTMIDHVGGSFQLTNNQSLTEMNSTFTIGGGIVFSGNRAMQALTLVTPQDEIRGDLTITNNDVLQTVSLGTMIHVDGNVEISGNPALVTPPVELVSVGNNLSVHDNPSLVNLGFDHLQQVGQAGQGIAVANNAALATIALPALTATPQLSIDSNPALQHLGLAQLTASNLSVTNNVELPACEVTAIFARIMGQNFQSGNDTTAVCGP